jgi:hypothetical protein
MTWALVVPKVGEHGLPLDTSKARSCSLSCFHLLVSFSLSLLVNLLCAMKSRTAQLDQLTAARN